MRVYHNFFCYPDPEMAEKQLSFDDHITLKMNPTYTKICEKIYLYIIFFLFLLQNVLGIKVQLGCLKNKTIQFIFKLFV